MQMASIGRKKTPTSIASLTAWRRFLSNPLVSVISVTCLTLSLFKCLHTRRLNLWRRILAVST